MIVKVCSSDYISDVVLKNAMKELTIFFQLNNLKDYCTQFDAFLTKVTIYKVMQ